MRMSKIFLTCEAAFEKSFIRMRIWRCGTARGSF
jgi:hypothetical protein